MGSRVWVRCSDGPEGEWEFDVIPRLGERVTLNNPYGYYEVVKVEHYPRSAETGVCPSQDDVGIALRLVLLDDKTDPVWG